MLERCLIGAMALGLALGAAVAGAWAHDESQYPDLKGQWVGLNGFGTTAVKVRSARSQNNSASSALETPTRPTLT